MLGRIKDIVNILNYCAFSILLVIGAFISVTQRYELLLLFFAFLTVYTVRVYFLESDSRKLYRILSDCLSLLLTFLICTIDRSGVELLLYLFLLDDIIMHTGRKAGVVLGVADYACFVVTLYFYFSGSSNIFWSAALLSVPAFGLFTVIFLLVNYENAQNARLASALKEITVQKLESQALYEELREAYDKAGEAAAQGERNRIAREIHDTVGHTLTTVLVELEAARKLLPIDQTRAEEKLALAQGQVRRGLSDIRRSVRMLEEKHDILGFYPSLDALLHDCEQNSGVVIQSEIDRSLPIVEETGRVLYACVQEGLTNGIRHGNSTAFVLKLLCRDGKISLSLEDNGKGASVLIPGFGMRAMRDRVEKLGGSLHFETEPDEGFLLTVLLPLFISEPVPLNVSALH